MMYILEIQNEQQLTHTLVHITKSIYAMEKSNTLEDFFVIPEFVLTKSSAKTKTEKISVREVREAKHMLHLRETSMQKLWIIYNAHDLTHEAQNTILKDIEENTDTLIILATQDKRQLLPTILSRGMALTQSDISSLWPAKSEEKETVVWYNTYTKDEEIEIEKFLSVSLYDQFLYIKERVSNEERRNEFVKRLMLNLLAYFESHALSHPNALHAMQVIEQNLEKMKKGVNPRTVLEDTILLLNNE